MGEYDLWISPYPLDSQPNTYRNGRPGLCNIKLWKTIVMIVRFRTSCSLSSKHFCRINAEKAQIHQNLRITKNIYKETQKFSSIEIKELSLLYIILNNLDFFYHRLDLLNDLLFFSKENKILFQLVEQSLKNGNYNNIDIDTKYLDNISKFATVKHIVKKNDDNHSKLLEIFEDIKKDLKTYSLELRIQELESKFAEDFNQNTFDEIRKLKKEQNIN